MGRNWCDEGWWWHCTQPGCKVLRRCKGEAARHYPEKHIGLVVKSKDKVKLIKYAEAAQLVGEVAHRELLRKRPGSKWANDKAAKAKATKEAKQRAKVAAQVESIGCPNSNDDDDLEHAQEELASTPNTPPASGSNHNEQSRIRPQQHQSTQVALSGAPSPPAGALPEDGHVESPVTGVPDTSGPSIDEAGDTVMNDASTRDADLEEVDDGTPVSAETAYQTCPRTLMGLPSEVRRLIIEHYLFRAKKPRYGHSLGAMDSSLLGVCKVIRCETLDCLASRMTIVQIDMYSPDLSTLEDLQNELLSIPALRISNKVNENRTLGKSIPAPIVDVHLKSAERQRLDQDFGLVQAHQIHHICHNFFHDERSVLSIVEQLQIEARLGILKSLKITFTKRYPVPVQRKDTLFALWAFGILRNVGAVEIHGKPPLKEEAWKTIGELMVSDKFDDPDTNRAEMHKRIKETFQSVKKHYVHYGNPFPEKDVWRDVVVAGRVLGELKARDKFTPLD
jgi:hypothetical protein